MTILLRITAAFSALWSVLLFFALPLAAGGEVTPLAATLAHTLAIAHLALAAIFTVASSDPPAHVPHIAVGIAFLAARVVADLVGVLGALPSQPALVFLIDLMIAFALVVGLLEALPRTVAEHRRRRQQGG